MSLEPLRTHNREALLASEGVDEGRRREGARLFTDDDVSVQSFEGEELQEEVAEGWCGSSNLRALWGLFTLNTMFAFAQIAAGLAANSLALLADSGSMLVDSVAYVVNILMEKKKNEIGSQNAKLYEVYASSLSVLLLIGVTAAAVIDGTKRINSDEEEEEVDGKIVFGFAAANMILDIVMCGHYFYQIRGRRGSSLKEHIQNETRNELNMVSAFVHLLADTMRSVTGMIAGILEERENSDTVKIDVNATFIVCSLILLAALFVIYETWQQYQEYREHRDNGARIEVEGYGSIDGSA